MECRKFKITIVSAENLPEGRSSGSMNVYAEFSLNGDPKTTLRTDADTKGKSNPTWNFTADYTIAESTIGSKGVDLIVNLYTERRLGHRSIGEVEICVKSLYDKGLMSENVLSYHVAGTPNGRLNISYSFGDKILVPKLSMKEKLVTYGVMAMAAGLGFGAGLEMDPRIDC